MFKRKCKITFISHGATVHTMDGIICDTDKYPKINEFGEEEIAKVCEYLHVNREDTYAVGDSVNDLDMLNYVGHGIAMGNATEPAKEAAEYITTDIHEDGIRHAMEHYGLIS